MDFLFRKLNQWVTVYIRYDRNLTRKTANRLSRRIRLWADVQEPACAASRRWLQRPEHRFNRVTDREQCHLGAGCSRSTDCPRPAARLGPAGRWRSRISAPSRSYDKLGCGTSPALLCADLTNSARAVLVEEPSSEIPTPSSATTPSSSSAPAATAPQKDFWDKLGAVTVLISSVVIGAAGVAATYVYNNHELEIKHEEKEAEEKRLQAQAEISRQIETNRRLEALFKYISSDKDNEREFGYAMFQALGQEALAVKIIALRKDTAGAAVVQSATASTDPGVAKQAELISAQLSLRERLNKGLAHGEME